MTTLNARALYAAAMAASKETIRPFLQGVYTYADETTRHYVATTGHYLIHIKEPKLGDDTQDFKGIIPAYITAQFKNTDRLLVNTKSIACDHVTIAYELIDGQFPDYTRVMIAEDKFAPVASVKFNADYLKKINDAYKHYNKIKPSSECGLELQFAGEGANSFSIQSGNFTALIMTYRK